MADQKTTCLNLIPCLIADSAAFIRNVDLQKIGEEVFTIGDVVTEIKDSATKQRLAVLPYSLNFREPSSESLNIVSNFSKKTGDFKSLSAVDLRVLALTYQLEKEFCDVEHIKAEPNKKVQVVGRSKIASDREMAGFYFEPKVKPSSVNSEEPKTPTMDSLDELKDEKSFSPDEGMEESVIQENCEEADIVDGNKNVGGDEGMDEEDDEMDEENDEGFTDQDNEGWITPSNIKSAKKKMGCDDESEVHLDKIKCACLTTDFAMQNVLIQMGLHVVSVNGMLIHQARNYIQICHGCYKETHNMEKIFCPGCGNKTLMKVAVTVANDGTIQYHYPKRKRNFNIRGTKYSMALPKGGRQPNNTPILTEDQKMSYNRLPKKQDQINPLDPDYVTRVSPFTQNDTNSRAFALGHHVRNNRAKNPNENKRKNGRRK